MPLDSAQGGPITATIRVPDDSHVGQARRAAAAMAIGIDPDTAGRLAIVVTELATNLARHATEGEILLSLVNGGIQVISVDKGPGILDLHRALEDGFSTGGTPGTGLGAVRRQADTFDVYSRPGIGTVVACRVGGEGVKHPARVMQRAAVCVPMPGERVSGDGWAVHDRPDGSTVALLVDGLGHGPAAATAADTAMETFTRYAPSASPAQMVDALNLALRPTRGAALAVAHLDAARRSVRFCGVGNISASIVTPEHMQSMVSSNGIVGHQMGRTREFEYAWPEHGAIIMHSDGLTTRWSVATMPGVLLHDLAIISTILYRDASRGRDDVTILAIRRAPDAIDMVPAGPSA